MNLGNGMRPDRDVVGSLAWRGEMGERTRTLDWSKTSVGAIENWPRALKTVVQVMLASRYAMWLGWGPDLTFFYNDDYARMTLGSKHPWALGRPASEVWSEIWDAIRPRTEQVVRTGQATWDESLLLFLERQGFSEETYHTFSYSPVFDDHGEIGGMLCVVTEDTERTIGERRLRTLRELAAHTAGEQKSVEEACRTIVQVLAENPYDVPFALLYLLDAEGERLTLAGSSGVVADSPISPLTVELRDEDAPWPFLRASASGKAVEVGNLPARIGPLLKGAWPEPSKQAVVLPMARPGQTQVAGFVVAGVSPRRPLDDAYRGFLDLLGGQVANAVANARAYEEERDRAEKLAELDRAKTAFFSNVSHEFRTPLTLMLGPVEDMLARPPDNWPAGTRELLEVVNRNGLRLLRLVNNLLDFSRIEAGRVRALYRPTDLGPLTADLASVFRSACERAGLRLSVNGPSLSEPVYVDWEMWEKVVLNLLSNAFKFTFEGEIEVTLRQRGRSVELRVRDTGTGIPAAEISKLFERFHRIEQAKGRTHEGSGIGLALVQEVIHLHGGSVAAESVVGEGTTFTVTLPLGSAHLPSDQIVQETLVEARVPMSVPFVQEALRWLPDDRQGNANLNDIPVHDDDFSSLDPSSDPSGRESGPRVLLADDNADMRQYVTRLLSKHFQVEAVADGEAALGAARAHPPDLVLTDVMMPRLDGFGLLQALRSDQKTAGIPVIMLSARAGEESRVEGMEAGADDYLVKPFGARELIARVSAHLQMAKMRRESNATLREGEERLRMALTAARMVAWQWNPSDGSLHVSENAADVFGLPKGTTLVKIEQGLALIHPDDAEGYRATFTKTIKERGSYLIQYRLVRPDNGRVLWMEERGHVVCNDSDEVVRLVGVVIDVTERKRVEDEIRDARSRLDSTLAAAEVGTWEFDLINDAVLADPNLARMFGVSAEEAAGGSVAAYLRAVHPDDRERVAGTIRDSIESGQVFESDYRLVGQDGSIRWVVARGRIERDETGQAVRLPGVVIDVTGQRLAEAELRASELRRRLALDSAELGAWNIDSTTHALNSDERFRIIFQGSPAAMDYAEAIAVIHPDDRERIKERVAAAMNPDDPAPYAEEYRVIHPDGSIHWVFGKGRANFETTPAGRRLVSFDGTIADVTERKRGEQERERLVGQLREQDQRKDDFLATLAHELRNPLAPIRNGLQIMKMSGNDRQAVEESRVLVERQVTHMVRLIDDLMDISRITSNKMELRRNRVELAAIVQNAVETSRTLVEEAGHELSVTLPVRPILIDADVTRLSQVFSNLLNNAAKYTERGGRIALIAERQGGDVVVTIRDNGVGIPQAMLPEVFTMFTQIDRTLERSQGGLGIGLSLVKTLVKMHGGTVEARSGGHGMGSEFVVRLPAVAMPGSRPEAAKGPAVKAKSAKSLRILVVDDNQDSARTLAKLLKLLGHQIRTANDGRDAVDIAEEYRPELILLDIGLPGLNGYDVAKAIRARSWGLDVVIVALTGWGQEGDRRRSKEAGIDDHLVKPVDPDVLERLLDDLKLKLNSTPS